LKRAFNIFWRAVVAGSFIISWQPCRAQETDYKAYTLFIYNFMKYVEWPEAMSKGDFTLAVVGDSPINKELQDLASNKKLKGRAITFKKYSSTDQIDDSHLIFLPSSKSAAMKTLKEQMKGKPVLIVGEREGLARKGAAISFVTMEDDQLRFDINRTILDQHNLKAASQLISLGIPVN
jgi:hypothetical protein